MTSTNIGYYLTTVCMYKYLNNFDDNCYELRLLGCFRDKLVPIKHYYSVAPIIVEGIEIVIIKKQYINISMIML